jgi:hypothetical protein
MIRGLCRAAFLLIAIGCMAENFHVAAAPEKKPAWIDTIPPSVRIDPRETYQSKVFHAALNTNEQGTIWVRVVRPGQLKVPETAMEPYKNPITVSEEGTTVVYFYAEDLVGNKSPLDSIRYVLDTRPPELSLSPPPGRYRSVVVVRFNANKPCRFFLYAKASAAASDAGAAVAETVVVKDSLSGFVTAIDRAGNKCAPVPVSYVVDSTVVWVTISPREGVYNKQQSISFDHSRRAEAYYSFDPSAPLKSFTRFEKPVRLPYGNTIVSYYAKNAYGWESDERKAAYTIDTIPPKVHVTYKPGAGADTLACSTEKNAVIKFTLDNLFPTEASASYEGPVLIPHRGRCIFRAIARDLAGNKSDVLEWTHKYDITPPVISLSKPSGLYNGTIRLTATTDKRASVFYTLDGSEPAERSLLYRNELLISKEGATKLRMIAIDETGNISSELTRDFVIDAKPPEVRVKIDENVKDNTFFVSLVPNKEATIYYETGGGRPGFSSPVYSNRVPLRMGQTISYFAVDKAGNRSEVKVVDDLKRPLVGAYPEGGVYRKILKVVFKGSSATRVFWRILPDTVFKPYTDSVNLGKEGVYSLEYFSESETGVHSPLRRNEYIIDLTPPHVTINVKKGLRDSVSVFFECTKNATIYYTTDGSNPFYSATTKTLGNKFLLSKDRLSIYRSPGSDVKLAYYAEDVAGNQSRITVLDVFKPQTVPNVPAGKDILYDRILSITLNTFDSRSRIYFSRRGKVPTVDSSVFINPITLVKSDTIIAFVVDAAGYKGLLDTFVYAIDLPPSPDFTIAPESLTVGMTVDFDASTSIDHETPFDKLQFQWDFIGDGKRKTAWSADPHARYTYSLSGIVKPVLEVRDENNRTASVSKAILVRSRCPPAMASVSLATGSVFCIDNFEWPNIAGEKPFTGVSWVQAKMYCLESGKRLCTPEEWVGACKGMKATAYPYGERYEKKTCPSEGKDVYQSGTFPKCKNAFGVFDMVGNAWEWVEGKEGDYPLMFGGSFAYGEQADCNLSSQGSVGTKSGEVGFRCCK